MRKIILGASAVLALVNAGVSAQTPAATQAPAPVVGLEAEAISTTAPKNAKAKQTQALAVDGGAPVVSLDSGMPVGSVGGDILSASAVGGGSRAYAEASYLLMFANKHGVATPLLTGGPSLGVVGRPGTTVVQGGYNLDYASTSGVRAAVGSFLGDSRVGFEANGLWLGRISESQSTGMTSAQVLARPFFDTTSRLENAKVIASPGAFQGGMTVDTSLSIWGAEANPFFRVVQGDVVTFDIITGFRYFQANETLNIYDATNLLAGGVTAWNGIGLAAPGSVIVHDHFGVQNRFYGGQVGAKMSFGGRGGWFLDFTGKVAIGAVEQVVTVDGTTTLSRGTLVSPATTEGGFLASGNYLGTRRDSRFAVLPEGNVQLGYQLTSFANVFAGYSFIYLSNAARPGDQLNRNIALNLLPTAPNYNNRRPTGTAANGVVSNELWIHGFNFGLTLAY